MTATPWTCRRPSPACAPTRCAPAKAGPGAANVDRRPDRASGPAGRRRGRLGSSHPTTLGHRPAAGDRRPVGRVRRRWRRRRHRRRSRPHPGAIRGTAPLGGQDAHHRRQPRRGGPQHPPLPARGRPAHPMAGQPVRNPVRPSRGSSAPASPGSRTATGSRTRHGPPRDSSATCSRLGLVDRLLGSHPRLARAERDLGRGDHRGHRRPRRIVRPRRTPPLGDPEQPRRPVPGAAVHPGPRSDGGEVHLESAYVIDVLPTWSTCSTSSSGRSGRWPADRCSTRICPPNAPMCTTTSPATGRRWAARSTASTPRSRTTTS